MEYTQDQLSAFKIETARRRQRAFVVVGVSTIFLLGTAAIFRQTGGGGTPWAILWVIWVTFAFTYSFRVWRCPACDGYLGRSISVKFCPRCGVPLQ